MIHTSPHLQVRVPGTPHGIAIPKLKSEVNCLYSPPHTPLGSLSMCQIMSCLWPAFNMYRLPAWVPNMNPTARQYGAQRIRDSESATVQDGTSVGDTCLHVSETVLFLCGFSLLALPLQLAHHPQILQIFHNWHSWVGLHPPLESAACTPLPSTMCFAWAGR